MALIRVEKLDELRPTHIVMLALVLLALVGNCLLTSAGKPALLPDGAVEWSPDSPLLAVVEILDLQYAQPTPKGVEVKSLIHGVAAGVGVLLCAIGLITWARADAATGAGDTVIAASAADAGGPESASLARRQLNPTRTAQAMMLVYLLWSFASVSWSQAPDYAWGGSVQLAIQTAWAFALGFGLNRRTAVYAGYGLLAVLCVTGVLAIAYHQQRNPTLRASYPIGNPIFLATCLLPGLAIALAVLVSGVSRKDGSKGIVKALFGALGLGVLAYASYLAGSRGPAIGLLLAIGVMILLAVGRRLRVVLGVGGVVGLIVLGGYLFSQRFANSPTGRSESMRLRLYSWPYALELFQQRPLLGIGQAGYSLQADVQAVADVEADPAPLLYRVAHAHHEWLEVAADLGTVGVVLILGSLGLTLLAALRSLSHLTSASERAMTVALIASLVGLIAAECFGVGLRLPGLPLVYFTIIGLLWALAAPAPKRLLAVLGRSVPACIGCAVLALAACLLMVEMSRREFSAARAAYDLPGKLESGDWENAERLAIRAYAERVDPEGKLVGQRLLAYTRLHLGEWFQQQYLRRLELLESTGGTDDRLRDQAVLNRRLSEAQLDLAESALADLVAVAPTMFDVGAPTYRVKALRAADASLAGDTQAAAQHLLAGAVALRNELARRPFEADLAAQYVLVDYARMETPEMLFLLARPLRLQRPNSLYLEACKRLITDSGDTAALLAPFDALAATAAPAERAEWPERYAPELLRLGSLIAFVRGDYSRSATYLSAAVPYYEILGGEALLSHAAARAELADMRLNAAPTDAGAAIASAEEVLKIAPRSQAGRELVSQVASRLVSYHLAAGNEEFARKIIKERAPGVTDAELDALIAERYVQLSFDAFEAVLAQAPDKLNTWSQRALALARESADPWFLAGELALRSRDAARIAEAAQAALQFGGDPQDVLGLLQRALTELPADVQLQKLHDELRGRLVEAGQPPGETEPGQTEEAAASNGLPVNTNGL